jgi:hypothetical protein
VVTVPRVRVDVIGIVSQTEHGKVVYDVTTGVMHLDETSKPGFRVGSKTRVTARKDSRKRSFTTSC